MKTGRSAAEDYRQTDRKIAQAPQERAAAWWLVVVKWRLKMVLLELAVRVAAELQGLLVVLELAVVRLVVEQKGWLLGLVVKQV